ncbi:MAG: hypothetical protein HQL22_11825 [Candidatus Omnitrophica bacterium]|nr:hypothetical protein [Candidatus Omnitrophota bacterium]
MATTEETMKQMDEAAAQAEVELVNAYAGWSAKDLVTWWSAWYLKAGHKRLGRILVAQGKKAKG